MWQEPTNQLHPFLNNIESSAKIEEQLIIAAQPFYIYLEELLQAIYGAGLLNAVKIHSK